MSVVMKASVFVERLKDIATNYSTLYVMGCIGAPMTPANKTRYINHHAYNRNTERTAMINAATTNTFGFDCVCLIKSVLWGWSGRKDRTYGGATYAANGVPDVSADGMIELCSGISSNFDKIEVGEAVWTEGHIGVYIGNGLAVECTPRWSNDVQITACNCTKAGYNTRKWKRHGKLPYIEYDVVSGTIAKPTKSIDAIAKEVIAGKWYSGAARKSALTKAGYDYVAVQTRVNELVKAASKSIDEVAKEVIAGKWYSGAARKSALIKAGHDYQAVQLRVNELIAEANKK